MNKITEQIKAGAEEAGKFYDYNETHDRTRPAEVWFQDSVDGLVMFVVFYTQACRYNRCAGCNLPRVMSAHHVDFQSIMSQVDSLFEMPEVVDKLDRIEKVIISNNGSVLDEETFSSTALIYLVAKCNLHLPQLAVFTMETRPEYVELHELEFLHRALNEGPRPTTLELSIGFEAFDSRIRNDLFIKGLELEKFEHFVSRVAEYNFRIKCYFMQKPVPGMSDAEALIDIQRGIDYLAEMATRYNVDINMHLNPTYVASGTNLEESFRAGKYSPPLATDVVRAILSAEGKSVSLFVGLFDEGLAVEGGSFVKSGDEHIVSAIEKFNIDQDYTLLKKCLPSD